MKLSQKDKEFRINMLKEMLDGTETIYTILRHVSRSGMYRVISLIIIDDNKPFCIDYLAGRLLEGIDNRHYGCKAHGCGMDMGFHLVYSLGHILYGNGYRFKQEWI